MPPVRGFKVNGVKILKVMRKNAALTMEDVAMDDTIRSEITATALEDFGALISLLQLNYGLVMHPSRTPHEFAYHWHDPDGTCRIGSAHDGFSNIAEAICAGIDELLSVERLNGMAPLAMALANAGVDLTGIIEALNELEDEHLKVKELTKAFRASFRHIVESGREQPSGFAGPAVAALLTVTRDIARIAGTDAHAVMGEKQLPIPAALPVGYVAVPAMAVVLLEMALSMIDGKSGGPQDDEHRSHITNAA